MSEQAQPSISEIFADHALITVAICRAVREAVLKHARDGHPVATWENGQVVWIQPDEILARPGNGPAGDAAGTTPGQ